MNRKSINREYFSCIAVTLVLGLAMMCGIQTALSSRYFVRERRAMLGGVLDGATALSQRFADEGTDVTLPDIDAALRQNAQERYALFQTAAGAAVFVTDADGVVLLHTGPDTVFTGAALPAALRAKMDAGQDIFARGTLDGVLTGRYYTVGRALPGGLRGYLLVTTPMDELTSYIGKMLSIFLFSAALMLLFSGLLSIVITRRVTAPIEAISDAARRLGGGDFAARAPVGGCVELADFAATFNNMADRLQTIDNARGQFMGNIAHELRTPMTTIKGFIDGMLDGTIPPQESQHYLAIVSQETGRLARLVQNMLDITKLEAGEMPIHARLYDLWQTVTDVVLADETRIEEGRIDIQGLGASGLTVYADPDLVHQVVYNLVDNAIKFTPPGGTIRFAAAASDGRVQMSVENTGPGIAPEALPYVFDRFYKEDRSRGMNTRGAGLGLHISKVLMTLQDGTLTAESTEGGWTSFTFTLPAAAPAAPAAAPAGKKGKRARRPRKGK